MTGKNSTERNSETWIRKRTGHRDGPSEKKNGIGILAFLDAVLLAFILMFLFVVYMPELAVFFLILAALVTAVIIFIARLPKAQETPAAVSGTIDRADWHWDGAEAAFRERYGVTGDLDDGQTEQVWQLACNHIGLFLRWIAENGLENDEYYDPSSLDGVRSGSESGTDFLLGSCDGKLWADDVREDVRPFVRAYYGVDYFRDFADCCLGGADGMDYVITDEEQYAALKEQIDSAYERWLEEDREDG